MDPIHCSANAFAHRAPDGVWIASAPMAANTLSNDLVYWSPRSRITNRARCSYPMSQAKDVGVAVITAHDQQLETGEQQSEQPGDR